MNEQLKIFCLIISALFILINNNFKINTTSFENTLLADTYGSVAKFFKYFFHFDPLAF